MIYIIDLDGVIRDFATAADNVYKQKFPQATYILKQYYDLDLRYPLWGKKAFDIIFKDHATDVFLNNAKPYEYSLVALTTLQQQTKESYIVTTCPAWTITQQWLSLYGIYQKAYQTTKPKLKFIEDNFKNKEVTLFDDNPAEFNSESSVQQICITHPWNEHLQKIKKYNSFWEAVKNVT